MTTTFTWQVKQTFTDGSGQGISKFSDFQEAWNLYQKLQQKHSQQFRVELFPVNPGARV
tara:strand:+ start:3203 stop:3379 length:177 start_codon:yes stop_codon:yes gene_type:complete